jgi:arginase family protein
MRRGKRRCSTDDTERLITSYEELREALVAIARHAEVVGFDLVEVNPMLDVASENTSLVAAQLIMEFLGRVVEHPRHRGRRRPPTRRTRSPPSMAVGLRERPT